MSQTKENVLSTRLELSRSIKGFGFVPSMKGKDFSDCIETVKNALRFHSDSFYPINCDQRSLAMYLHLYEKGIAALPNRDEPGISRIFVKEDLQYSVQVNSIEHVVIRSSRSGLDFEHTYNEIYGMEHHLQKFTEFLFNPSVGYITSRPDRTGTGLKASVLLHLPAIVKVNFLNAVNKTVQERNFLLRPAFVEKKATGAALFLLENRFSNGIDEHELIGMIYDMTGEICSAEEQARSKCIQDDAGSVSAKANASFRRLKDGHAINEVQFMNLISDIRFAIECGMFSALSSEKADELFYNGMNGGIIRDKIKVDPKLSVDALRSKVIREYLNREETH